MRFVAFLCIVCWAVVVNATDISIEARNPRPFGYVVGDIFEQELSFSVKRTLQLDQKKLPKPGRLNAWLELREILVTETSYSDTKRFRIKLSYQLPNSPTEVRVIELPAHSFSFFESNKKLVEIRSTEWPITVGPITPPEVLARDGLEALRPDVEPQGIDVQFIQKRILFYSLALAALLLYWAYRYFGVPFLARQRRPFTRTYRQLDRLAKKSSPDVFPKAVESLHQALNETAGKSLFMENVEQFLAQRSIPESLANKTREFFRISRDEFFGGGASESQRTLAWVMDFCKAWRDVERGTT